MPLLLFLLILVVPLLELWILIEVGGVIGVPATILALLGISLVGAVLVRREGWKAWNRFRIAVGEGRMPAGEVVDGALLVLGGALLLTPGFLTDAVGLALVIPLTRMALRGLVRRRVTLIAGGHDGAGKAEGRRRDPRGSSRDGNVVDVEVVRVERDEPKRLDDGDQSR